MQPQEPKHISADLKPKSKADEQARARFFAHSMFARAKSYIRDGLEKSKADLNGSLSSELQLSPTTSEEAAKKLAVVCVHLAGLERGGTENPEWFLDFLFASLRETDRMAAQPSAKSLIELHGQWIRPEIISGVVENALRGLSLRDSKAIVASHLTKMMDDDRSFRCDLVDFALTESLKVLEEQQMQVDISPL